MAWFQAEIRLSPRPRGFHLVTREILDGLSELSTIQIGLVHIFLRHTSASITINENADSDVLRDLESSLNSIAPEDFPYRHTVEGPDDMPAHVKSSLIGCELTIPIRKGKLSLGTWQGIYLCEHRNSATARQVVVTAWGE